MKLFFAKYLPEGKQYPCNCKIIYDKVYNNCCGVKLFLCSRDIQVGDKITLDGISFTEFTRLKELSKVYAPKFDSYFKVIGEISPEAIWVKEGDEFEEEDIKYSIAIIYNGGTDKIVNYGLFTFNKLQKYFDEHLWMKENHKYLVCKIKCSQCNTFH